MAKNKSVQHTGILEYALRHLEQEMAELQEKIDHVKSQLGVKVAAVNKVLVAAAAPAAAAGRAKRVLSPAARKRIAAAQRKRWAEHRKNLKAAGKKAA
jgi:hypothetical protein